MSQELRLAGEDVSVLSVWGAVMTLGGSDSELLQRLHALHVSELSNRVLDAPDWRLQEGDCLECAVRQFVCQLQVTDPH